MDPAEYDRIEVELRRLLDEALRYVEEAKAKLRYVAENLNMIKVLKESKKEANS